VQPKAAAARTHLVFSFYASGVQQPTRLYRSRQTGALAVPIAGSASQNANLTAAYRTQPSVTDGNGTVWELLETLNAPGHQ
jgi:hypothetical protein